MLTASDGRLVSNDTWEYKPPLFQDIPIDFRISLLKNSPFAPGVGKSKAVGEPPMLLSVIGATAVRKALQAARRERNLSNFVDINVPITIDKIQSKGYGLLDFKNFSFTN